MRAPHQDGFRRPVAIEGQDHRAGDGERRTAPPTADGVLQCRPVGTSGSGLTMAARRDPASFGTSFGLDRRSEVTFSRTKRFETFGCRHSRLRCTIAARRTLNPARRATWNCTATSGRCSSFTSSVDLTSTRTKPPRLRSRMSTRRRCPPRRSSPHRGRFAPSASPLAVAATRLSGSCHHTSTRTLPVQRPREISDPMSRAKATCRPSSS